MQNKVFFGDNINVLQSSLFDIYKNSIKLIYIDPPYNTKTLKSYNDKIDSEIWKNNLFNVISALYNLLKDDGILFISIDDSEYAILKIICDEIFTKSNFIGTFITKQSQRSNSKFINIVHEYVLCYAKNKNNLKSFSIKRIDIPEQRDMINDIMRKVKSEFMQYGKNQAEKKLKSLIKFYCEKFDITWLKNYHCVDENGDVYFASDLSVPGKPRSINIEQIQLHLEPLKTRSWVSDDKFIELSEKNLLSFHTDRPYCKKFLKNSEDNVPSILNFYSRHGTRDLNNLGLRDIFDTPKPVELIKFLIRVARIEKNDLVLDCYAGSGTTAQAVLEINAEDNQNISFILIQNKEKIDSRNKIYNSCKKYGIKPVVSEITKLRLEKVFQKLNIKNNVEYIDYE